MRAAQIYYPDLPLVDRMEKLHNEPVGPMGLINMGDGVFLDVEALKAKFEEELERTLAEEDRKMPRVVLMDNDDLDKFQAREVWKDLDEIHFFED